MAFVVVAVIGRAVPHPAALPTPYNFSIVTVQGSKETYIIVHDMTCRGRQCNMLCSVSF